MSYPYSTGFSFRCLGNGNYPYHKFCYKEHYHPKCDVCKHFIPTNAAGLIEYRAHPFWVQKYCPFHEHDGTPRCCSCERMEPRETKYVALEDGRKLCLECLDSAIMDTNQCQPLYLDIQEFYERLNMKVEQQVPLLLVERQALNEAMDGKKSGHHHMPETRGLCLSEEQTVSTDKIAKMLAEQSQPGVTNPQSEVQVSIDVLGKRSGYLKGYRIRKRTYATQSQAVPNSEAVALKEVVADQAKLIADYAKNYETMMLFMATRMELIQPPFRG